MTSERAMSAQDIKSGIERFRLGDRSDVAVLYPDVCFASLEAVGDMPVTLLVESVLAGWRPESQLTTTTSQDNPAPFPVASLVVSRDGAAQFHPELSNREPVEIQVWADGRVSLEIEFQGADVTSVAARWAATAARVLESWAATHGVQLVGVFNDRARSLPDVWNASFSVTAPQGHVVHELVELGERALRTAELSMTGWGGEDDVRRLLANGDVHAVLGWAPSVVLEFWDTPPDATQSASFAADVCAFANGVRGGAIVIGVQAGPQGASLQPFVADDHVTTVQRILQDQLFPVPERVVVKHLAITGDDDGRGILVVQIPPQDELVWPFVVHSRGQQVTLVERDGAESITRSVAAVHAALSAGTAYLRGNAGRVRGL
jgi:hypothetical protein